MNDVFENSALARSSLSQAYIKANSLNGNHVTTVEKDLHLRAIAPQRLLN